MAKLYPKPLDPQTQSRLASSAYSLNPKRAFTLIELIVVITILAILTAFGTYTFENAQKKSRDSRRKEDLKAIKSALLLYYNDHKDYPGPRPFVPQNYASNNTGTWISGLTPDYIPTLPKDPKQTTTLANCVSQQFIYCYQPTSTDTFILWAQVENTNDRQLIGKPDSPCPSPPPTPPSASLNYCLTNPN